MSSSRRDAATLWHNLQKNFSLSDEQLQKLIDYHDMVVRTNELFNLTAIVELKSALAYHYADSLMLGRAIDLTQPRALIDVGTGAGFPSIPLAIAYPHLSFVLVEVTHKKCEFLKEVSTKLGLTNIEICDYDWRTFLRKTSYPADYVIARASLAPEELIRMFKPASPYKTAQLVYWASDIYAPTPRELPFFMREYPYSVGNRERKLVFFTAPKSA